ncbi:MAG: hypothetical protein EA367_06950 [Leptolyngbya sp. DLM2.Bin15]|nr:MAG: hypothetical protein EA367_06950 [Leptolyngbya sp. DLM2.Bin15]
MARLLNAMRFTRGAIALATPRIDYSGLLFLAFLSPLLVIATIRFWKTIKDYFVISLADNLKSHEE